MGYLPFFNRNEGGIDGEGSMGVSRSIGEKKEGNFGPDVKLINFKKLSNNHKT